MTREPGKPGGARGDTERRQRYLVAGKTRGSYMESPRGHQAATPDREHRFGRL